MAVGLAWLETLVVKIIQPICACYFNTEIRVSSPRFLYHANGQEALILVKELNRLTMTGL
jgi:hypothetical protein